MKNCLIVSSDSEVDLGGLDQFNKKTFVLFLIDITFFSLFTVLIILLSKCCLFYLLSNGI